MTEITTVRTITTSASRKDRKNAPEMSTEPWSDQSTLNQWKGNPFMGKTSPPSGPWNDSATIANIGPQRNRTNRVNRVNTTART